MNRALLIPPLVALWPISASAEGVAGDFDYYVLSLSWQPGWCRTTGDAQGVKECDRGSGLDFTVHGLWPQYERGYPEYCETDERDPSRRETRAMGDLMPAGLALHQWRKHGRCSGLSATDYYDILRKAAQTVAIPGPFDDLARDIALPPAVVEEAFTEANPILSPDGVTVICKAEVLQEVRICLTRDLQPRDCAQDVRQDCSQRRVLMERTR